MNRKNEGVSTYQVIGAALFGPRLRYHAVSRSMAFLFLLFILFLPLAWSVEEIKYTVKSDRNPMIPLLGPNAPPPPKPKEEEKPLPPPPPPPEVKFDYIIQGIVYDPPASSLVLIDGEFYKEGDNVNGANIISIFRDRVILAKSDKTKALWIRDEILPSGTLVLTPHDSSSRKKDEKNPKENLENAVKQATREGK